MSFWDKTLIILVLILISLSAMYLKQNTGLGGKYIVVREFGRIVYIHGLPAVLEKIIKTRQGSLKLEIEEYKARISGSDCPRKICMRYGWIQDKNAVIVCVPLKIMVSMEVDSSEPETDAVSF